MFAFKTSLPRRTFLRGMGAALGLPLLDAMVPALTAQSRTAANAAKRLACVYVPHGAFPEHWTPATTGANFTFSRILEPLEPYRDSMVVVTNLHRPEAGGNSNHAGAPAAFLSGTMAKRTDGPDFSLGMTVDQLIAKEIGQDTVLPSLEVATEDFTALLGSCAPGYSCAYANTLSWQSPTAPLPMEINPRAVFERLFGAGDTAERRMARMKDDRTILDFVTRDLARLKRRIGSADQLRLDEYLDHVREVERRIQRAERQAETTVAVPTAPVGVPASFEEHVALQFELAALAYETDLTRVFSFMMARELSQRTFPEVGATLPYHMLSHHRAGPGANDMERVEAYTRVNVYYVQQLIKFLDRMRNTPDGDGSLLDHSLVLYGSGMGDGDQHSAEHLPLLVVGGKAFVNGNRHVAAPDGTPNANLLLSLADKFGVEQESFGVSTGRIEI